MRREQLDQHEKHGRRDAKRDMRRAERRAAKLTEDPPRRRRYRGYTG